ncbi:hypothetical protein FRC20_005272 [Serendipita sp. 405]|nr:hypothetical protein FRC20_005272 [Serendipita sp. 405]
MEYSPFRKCVDGVTENALAIVNTIPSLTPVDKFKLALTVSGIFICGAMLFALALIYATLLILREKFSKWLYGDPFVMDRVRRERETELRYENHP